MCLGKKRRLQFVECPNDINGMIDAAKYADLALLLIDGSYGFEMVRCLFLISEFIYFLFRDGNSASESSCSRQIK